jgi:hypothetical protein
MITNKWLLACLKSIPDPTGSQGSAGAVLLSKVSGDDKSKYAISSNDLQLHIKKKR